MSRCRLARVIEELAGPWSAAGEDRLRARRGHGRLRASGAGPDHDLPFVDLDTAVGPVDLARVPA
jgi:hypothetical protein